MGDGYSTSTLKKSKFASVFLVTNLKRVNANLKLPSLQSHVLRNTEEANALKTRYIPSNFVDSNYTQLKRQPP